MAIGNLLTMTEVGDILHVSNGRVSQFVKAGRLPVALRLGKMLLFEKKAVAQFASRPRKSGRPIRN